METIAISDDLLATLKERAAANRRSLDAEAQAAIERGLSLRPNVPLDPVLIVREDRDGDHGRDSLVSRIRQFREGLPSRMAPGGAVRLIREDRDGDHGSA